MTFEEFIKFETKRLEQFEEWWRNLVKHRYPDEAPDSNVTYTVWLDRMADFDNE